MNNDLIAQLCVYTWLPLIIIVWFVIVFHPGLSKRKRK